MKVCQKETTRSDFFLTLPVFEHPQSRSTPGSQTQDSAGASPLCTPSPPADPPPRAACVPCSGPILLFQLPSIFVLPFQAGLGQRQHHVRAWGQRGRCGFWDPWALPELQHLWCGETQARRSGGGEAGAEAKKDMDAYHGGSPTNHLYPWAVPLLPGPTCPGAERGLGEPLRAPSASS